MVALLERSGGSGTSRHNKVKVQVTPRADRSSKIVSYFKILSKVKLCPLAGAARSNNFIITLTSALFLAYIHVCSIFYKGIFYKIIFGTLT